MRFKDLLGPVTRVKKRKEKCGPQTLNPTHRTGHIIVIQRHTPPLHSILGPPWVRLRVGGASRDGQRAAGDGKGGGGCGGDLGGEAERTVGGAW